VGDVTSHFGAFYYLKGPLKGEYDRKINHFVSGVSVREKVATHAHSANSKIPLFHGDFLTNIPPFT
jgi:hypothetical protein